MKNYLRQIILAILGLLLLTGIYIVDVVFYRVPNFIKVFRIEREVASVVAVFLVFPLIKALYEKHITTIRQICLLFISLIISMTILLFLPHLILKKYIVLWDNNPMLAEFPVVWNLYSILSAVIFTLALLLLIHIIKKMTIKKTNRFLGLMFNLLFFMMFLGAGLLNFLEDRYLFQPVLNGYLGLFNDYKVGIISVIILSATVSLGGDWLEKLNRKGKYLCFFGGLIVLVLLTMLFSSPQIVAVYAYSTTIKGFVLLGYLFVLVFFLVSVVKILFQLPMAGKMDRVAMELDFIEEIEAKLKISEPQKLISMIVEMSMKISNAQGCWIELKKDNNTFEIVESLNIDQKLIDTVGYFTMDHLKERLITRQQVCRIDNIPSDPATKHFKYLDCGWKSLLAFPLSRENRIVGALYIVKNRAGGFSDEDHKTLGRFLLQLEKVLQAAEGTKTDNQPDLQLDFEHYSLEVSAPDYLRFDYLPGKKASDCCVFGLENLLSDEKRAEIRGSLKMLMQMSESLNSAMAQVQNFMQTLDSKISFVFYFLNVENGGVVIYKNIGLDIINQSGIFNSQAGEDLYRTDIVDWCVFSPETEEDMTNSDFRNIAGEGNKILDQFAGRQDLLIIQKN